MDMKNYHPFNAISGYENLSMLESLIPFVDFPLKLPLALFIKFSEIRLIINCFQSRDNLVHLGFHNPSNSPLDMVAHFTGMSPEMLTMMFSMMNSDGNGISPELLSGLAGSAGMDFSGMNFANAGFQDKTFSGMNFTNTGFKNMNFSDVHTPRQTTADISDNFQKNIAQILAEYDAEQDNPEHQDYSINYPNYE